MGNKAIGLALSFLKATGITTALLCGVVGCSEKKPAGPPEVPRTETTTTESGTPVSDSQ